MKADGQMSTNGNTHPLLLPGEKLRCYTSTNSETAAPNELTKLKRGAQDGDSHKNQSTKKTHFFAWDPREAGFRPPPKIVESPTRLSLQTICVDMRCETLGHSASDTTRSASHKTQPLVHLRPLFQTRERKGSLYCWRVSSAEREASSQSAL